MLVLSKLEAFTDDLSGVTQNMKLLGETTLSSMAAFRFKYNT